MLQPFGAVEFERFRSKVPKGRWPALRAVSRIRQSENPNDGGRYLRMAQFIHGRENPRRFHEHQRRYPCSFAHARFGGTNLLAVAAGDQADQDIAINGARFSSLYSAAHPHRNLLISWKQALRAEKSRGECLRTRSGPPCARRPRRLPLPIPAPSRDRYQAFVALLREQKFVLEPLLLIGPEP